MKEIEIIPLARRKMERRAIPESWVAESAHRSDRGLGRQQANNPETLGPHRPGHRQVFRAGCRSRRKGSIWQEEKAEVQTSPAVFKLKTPLTGMNQKLLNRALAVGRFERSAAVERLEPCERCLFL